jgi:hypothetical protein
MISTTRYICYTRTNTECLNLLKSP